MKVRFTMNARRRLGQIMDHHRDQGIPETGKKLIKEIRENAKLLGKHPKMGQKEEQLSYLGQGHRYLFVKPFYKLIYLIVKPIIFITDVFDTRQDTDKMRS